MNTRKLVCLAAAGAVALTSVGCSPAAYVISDQPVTVHAWGHSPYAPDMATAKSRERAETAARLLNIPKADRKAWVDEMMRKTDDIVTLGDGDYITTNQKNGVDGAERDHYVGRRFRAERHRFEGKIYYIFLDCRNYGYSLETPARKGGHHRQTPPTHPECATVAIPLDGKVRVDSIGVALHGHFRSACPAYKFAGEATWKHLQPDRANCGFTAVTKWLGLPLDAGHEGEIPVNGRTGVVLVSVPWVFTQDANYRASFCRRLNASCSSTEPSESVLPEVYRGPDKVAVIWPSADTVSADIPRGSEAADAYWH